MLYLGLKVKARVPNLSPHSSDPMGEIQYSATCSFLTLARCHHGLPWHQVLATAMLDHLTLNLCPHSYPGLPRGEGVRCFTHSDLFNPCPLQGILLSWPFYKWREWSTESLRLFPKSHSKLEVELGFKPCSTSVGCHFKDFAIKKLCKHEQIVKSVWQRGKRTRGRGREISSRERISVYKEARVRRDYESNQISSRALVTNACNLSYLGVWDQKNCSSRLA
jgi:hypothetical protein